MVQLLCKNSFLYKNCVRLKAKEAPVYLGQNTMVYSYFPGCTLKTKGKDLDIYGRNAAEKLGVTLEELTDWQCCGAVYPLASDEIATKLSSVRALVSAKEKNQPLVTLCSACHHVIKRVNNDMKTKEDIALRVNNYLGLDEAYNGEISLRSIRRQGANTDMGFVCAFTFETVRRSCVIALAGKY